MYKFVSRFRITTILTSIVRFIMLSTLLSVACTALAQDAQQADSEVALGSYSSLNLGAAVMSTSAGKGRFVNGFYGIVKGSGDEAITSYDGDKTSVVEPLPLLLFTTGYRFTEAFSVYLDVVGTPYVGVRYRDEELGEVDFGLNFITRLLGSGSNEYRNPYALGVTREQTELFNLGARFSYAFGPVKFTTTYTQYQFKNDTDDQTTNLTVTEDTGSGTRSIATGTFGREGNLVELQLDTNLSVMSFGLGYKQASLDGEADSYSGPSGSLGTVISLSDSTALNLSVNGGVITHDAENPFFAETRKDTTIGLSATVSYGKWTFIATASQEDSNIDFFDDTTAVLGFAYYFDLHGKSPLGALIDAL